MEQKGLPFFGLEALESLHKTIQMISCSFSQASIIVTRQLKMPFWINAYIWLIALKLFKPPVQSQEDFAT